MDCFSVCLLPRKRIAYKGSPALQIVLWNTTEKVSSVFLGLWCWKLGALCSISGRVTGTNCFKNTLNLFSSLGFPGGSLVKKKKTCLQCGRPGFDPWVGKIPWRRQRLPTPVFWAGELHELFHGITKSRT